MQENFNPVNDFTVISLSKSMLVKTSQLKSLLRLGAPQNIIDNQIQLIQMIAREMNRKAIMLN